ncbi:MAG: energy transducer TonB [Woeseia sp.]|nr:energy transducer TonB [Woeseia sp.]
MFVAIEYMVGNRRIRLAETSDLDISNFIRVAEQSREVRSRRDPEAPMKPQNEMQQDLQTLTNLSQDGAVSGMEVGFPEINVDIDVGGGIAVARELTPLVRIPPRYPTSARMNGTEGYVDIRFTVTETGAVANPEVLRSDPPGVFDRAATRAVLRWKYQPQIVDGKPASVRSYARLVFEMMEE